MASSLGGASGGARYGVAAISAKPPAFSCFSSSARTRSSRAVNRRSESDFAALASLSAGLAPKNSRFSGNSRRRERISLSWPGPNRSWTKPGAPAHHLPELCLGANLLEEDEIDDLGHVDPGVEHVDGDRDVRRLVFGSRNRRSVSGAYLGLIGDDARELPGHTADSSRRTASAMNVGVVLVLGEDDCLPQLIAVRRP